MLLVLGYACDLMLEGTLELQKLQLVLAQQTCSALIANWRLLFLFVGIASLPVTPLTYWHSGPGCQVHTISLIDL
jgi:hypothetical protein